jgi:photosystem II stability/assembly factor-like uncharacterized protein
MRRLLVLVATILAGLLVAGCGSSGSSADPPASVVAVAGDGIVTVSWPMASGVDYWLFFAPSPSISISNWTTILGSKSVLGATSPYVTTGLANGTLYSFTLNGRTDNGGNLGPGGPGTPSVSAIPRLAGTATATLPAPWTAGAALGANDLRGVMACVTVGVTCVTVFVAVGAGGVMYSSPDGVTWTAITSRVTSNLNAAAYLTTGIYAAVGDSGAMLYSTDAITWTPQVTGTTQNLNGIGAGGGRFVAVGAGGTIISSTDGINWTTAASSGTVTTNDLYAVTSNGSGLWVAVGKNGALLTSADGSANTWTSVNSNTVLALKGITLGTNATTGALVYVAVGASGALVTSPDAVTWTAQTAIGRNTLSAVTSVTNSLAPIAVTNNVVQTCGTQFVAVGDSGTIFTSTDGTTWVGQPSTTSSNLKAIVHGLYGYSVVGAAGVNLLAQ